MLLSYVAKTKALISCVVTAQLICVFAFAYAKSRFSHDEAQLFYVRNLKKIMIPVYVKKSYVISKTYPFLLRSCQAALRKYLHFQSSLLVP